jgi:hypothetical protein
MGSIGMALCLFLVGNGGVSGAEVSPTPSGRMGTTPSLPNGFIASKLAPRKAARANLNLRILPKVASLDRARFLEDTEEEIYHENTKSVIHALGLAMLPNLFYKPLAIGLAWKYCDKNEDKKYLAFLTAVPASGFGSFYGEWEWAGILATVGDLAGSSLMAWYFYDEHAGRNDPGGSQTKLWAGIGVAAFFWVFDMVMGPVAAMQFNSNLRKRYLKKKSKAPKKRSYVTPPRPEEGMADIGPRPSSRRPVVIGYAGHF